MKRGIRRAAGVAAVLAAAAALASVAYFSVRIERQSARDEARPADVILVLGAAEYRGRPSPVLRARLDHALELYNRKLAPRIMTTGGAGGELLYTEGAVGRSYLIGKGVPAEAIVVETEGESTVHSTALAGEIMRRMGLRSAIVVSDGYHVYRVKKILESTGLAAYGSPRKDSNPHTWRERWNCVKQAIGYLLWRAGVKV
ncbi:MAG: YdcF family protein [Bryobacteraceae bacterium]